MSDVMRAIPIALALCSFSTEAAAQASGSITGQITVLDFRQNPYWAAGYPTNVAAPAGGRLTTGFNTNGGTVVTLREAEVRLYVYQSASIYTVRYARTNALGQYQIDWSEAFTPIKIKVAVIARRPNLATASSTTTPPSFRFAINGIAGTVLTSEVVSTAFTGNIDVSFDITQRSDAISSFLTAREVYAMFGTHGAPVVGGATSLAMHGVVISSHATVRGGITPTDSQIFVGPGVPTGAPFIVAHELGHALVWRSLGLSFPIIEPLDYLCVFPGRPDAFPSWDDFSYECEKVAFQEGLANLNAALWMWRRDSTNRIVPRAPNPWGLEGRGTDD